MKSRVVGDRELMRAMRGVTQQVTGNVLDQIIRESLEPMRAQTQENALKHRQHGTNPKGGHLDQGIVTARVKAQGRSKRIFWISFRRRARKIAHFVEFGTAPHWQPRRGIMHPGARPFPFFRPAFESEKGPTVKRFSRLTWMLIRDYTLRVTKTRRR